MCNNCVEIQTHRIELIIKLRSNSTEQYLVRYTNQLNFFMESMRVNNNRSITSDENLAPTKWKVAEVTIKDTFMEEVKVYTIYKIATFINNYWSPVLIPIGLMGNILSFLVMTKPNNRKMSTCIYMAAISINDNIMMCICLHDYLVSSVHIHTWTSIE